MNRCEFIGRLTKDPELRKTNTDISVVKFDLAVNRKFKNEKGESIADFFNVVAWRELAENINKYCKKGSKVYIAGELQNRSYDKKDGTKGYITEVIAYECEFLDPKTDNTSSTTTNENVTNNTNNVESKQIPEDDLPF